ncbi:MAG TPA: adenylate/guanylate cyclase domain-containing protein [Candidatus Limnocylindria bacterium]
MARFLVKNLDSPDEVMNLDGVRAEIVDLGDFTVAWQVLQPGWRWSVDIRPLVGGDWCQSRHAGYVFSGRMHVLFDDGTELEVGPRSAYVIAPGHDGWVVGDEPVTGIEWSGFRSWVPALESQSERVLATVLFTDIVDSTGTAARLGDAAWRVLLGSYNERAREIIGRFRGREIATTGDGFLATFDGPGRGVRCAAELIKAADAEGLAVRAGVHTGEIELVADDVRGITVHEASRIMARARPGEVLVSAVTRELASGAGVEFEDRGEHDLRGLDGPRRLFGFSA